MKEYYIKLFKYENWANKEVADLLTGIGEPPEKSISLMSHVINAQILWLSRIKKESCEVGVWQVYDKSEILNELNASSENIMKFISSITEDELKKIIDYKNTKGENFKSPLEDILTHMTHHSAYHRGQIIMLLKPEVTVVPYTDYNHFARSIK